MLGPRVWERGEYWTSSVIVCGCVDVGSRDVKHLDAAVHDLGNVDAVDINMAKTVRLHDPDRR